ncbi:undecaprenyl-diphosphate phosphatase [Candidatus Micrarchaeota archaeon]|nr:undecaprenyl-diphosphate phosphatase [Candidatus Micrarchaeota archaeon]MBU1166223.1 undecaprenyl-diphosphate phosphatase [Candidatus Micrarchaeota archaeon]MBU1886196.1 undecaprenyl-diphosphate phosphatase [Candidatus Micrarchaeota archaeon]
MDFIIAILLGVIQGIAEWLPISSEAMVTVIGKFIGGMEYQDALAMAIWLHTGTLISATIYFHKDILSMIKSIWHNGADRNLLLFLIIATAASFVIAFPLLLIAFSIELPEYITTIFIGIFLVFVAVIQKNRVSGKQTEPTPKNAVIAGLVQGFSALPGMSRSGLTLAILVAQNYDLKQAFRLSFLMSIPVVLGAQIALPLVKSGFEITVEMLVGTVVAALIGLLTIRLLMQFAEKVNFFKATLGLGILVIIIGIVTLSS